MQADVNLAHHRAPNGSNTSGLGRRMRKGESESRKSLKNIKQTIYSTHDKGPLKDNNIMNRTQRT
jgi:hypothetical protein